MKNLKNKGIGYIHIAVFLWGFTGILGNVITLSALSLVWWRLLFCCVFFLPFCIKKLYSAYQNYATDFYKAILMGVFLALHWITFYGSLKLATVSIAVVCLSSTAFFTNVIEYFVHRTKTPTQNILLSIMSIVGIGLIFNFETQYRWGIVIGTISSVFNAVIPIFNKKIIERLKPFPTLTLEFFSGCVFLGLGILLYQNVGGFEAHLLNIDNIMYLLILCIFCTAIPFYLAFVALQYIEPFTENIIVNLEPVYTIIIAFIFFDEYQKIGVGFYIGVLIIFVTVMAQTYIEYKNNKGLK